MTSEGFWAVCCCRVSVSSFHGRSRTFSRSAVLVQAPHSAAPHESTCCHQEIPVMWEFLLPPINLNTIGRRPCVISFHFWVQDDQDERSFPRHFRSWKRPGRCNCAQLLSGMLSVQRGVEENVCRGSQYGTLPSSARHALGEFAFDPSVPLSASSRKAVLPRFFLHLSKMRGWMLVLFSRTTMSPLLSITSWPSFKIVGSLSLQSRTLL